MKRATARNDLRNPVVPACDRVEAIGGWDSGPSELSSCAWRGDRWAKYEFAQAFETRAKNGPATGDLSDQAASNRREAFDWYLSAARQGLAEAQMEVARFYDEGIVVPKDERQAAAWIKRAADQGNIWAALALAERYARGRGVDQDEEAATRLYSYGAQAGVPYALYEAGVRLLAGTGTAPDPKFAVALLRKAADKGVKAAPATLADAYANGRGVTPDQGEATRWYRRAAELGDGYAMAVLAERYAKGIGTQPDEAELMRWLERSAQAGNVWSQLAVGERYEKGNGVPADAALAREWYAKAAEVRQRVRAGGRWAPCMRPGEAAPRTRCGRPTCIGARREKGYVPAQAASSDHVRERSRRGAGSGRGAAVVLNGGRARTRLVSQIALAELYEGGRGVPKNPAEALRWQRQAASAGTPGHNTISAFGTLTAEA